MEQKPSVGRIVHYQSYGSVGGKYLPECRAAIVTAVEEGPIYNQDNPTLVHPGPLVSVAVFNPEGMFFNRSCVQDEETKNGGTWHWPERV